MTLGSAAMSLETVRRRRAHRPRSRVGVVALGGVGGSSRVAFQVARGLAEEGHHAVLLSRAEARCSSAETHGVRLRETLVPRAPRAATTEWVASLAGSLVDAVREDDLCILNVHYGAGMAAAAVEARRRLATQGRYVRVCVTLHGTDVTRFGRDPVQGPALARALRGCDEVTAVSHWLADEAVRVLGLGRRPTVIENGVDTELFRPRERAYRAGRPVLCHASSFRAVKRPLDAIAVLEHLRRDGIDAALWMVGDGPLRDEAVAHARALGPAVRFVPTLPHADLAALLAEVDLSVVTSASESFGLFALESMACGVPVLGTRCGGLEEVLAADPSGELQATMTAGVGEVQQLARHAAAALSDPRTYARLRRRALFVGQTAFPRARQVRSYASVMQRLTRDIAA